MRWEGRQFYPSRGVVRGRGRPPLRRPLLMSTADKNITGPRKHMAYLCSANRLYKCPCPPINKAHSCVTLLTHEKQIFLQNIGWRRAVGIFILLTTMLYNRRNGKSTAYDVSFAKTIFTGLVDYPISLDSFLYFDIGPTILPHKLKITK